MFHHHQHICCLFLYHFYLVCGLSYQEHIHNIYRSNTSYTKYNPFINNILIHPEWNCHFIDKLFGMTNPCGVINANKATYNHNGIGSRLMVFPDGFSVQFHFRFAPYTYDFVYDWLDIILSTTLSQHLNLTLNKEEKWFRFYLSIPRPYQLKTFWQKCFYRYMLDSEFLESSRIINNVILSYKWTINREVSNREIFLQVLQDYDWNRRKGYVLVLEKGDWVNKSFYFQVLNLPQSIKCLIYQYL